MPPVTRHAARACTPVQSTPPASPNTRSKLKRSASTASLPSPPPTVRRKVCVSKAAVYSSSEDEAGELPVVALRATPTRAALPRLNLAKIIEEGEGTEEEGEGKAPHEEAKDDAHRLLKKRRLSDLVTELNSQVKGASEAEDAFWLDSNHPRAGTSKPSPSKKPTSNPNVESDAEEGKKHPSRVAQAKEGAYSLASPPPSRVRRSTTKTKTAKPRSKTAAIKGLKSILNPRAKTQARLKDPSGVKNKVPVRDPVNNPFLSDSLEAPPPKRQIPYNQMPTLTYVFRGKRQEFQNPEYKAPPDPRTRLPIDHEDYVASEDIKPRRLFGVYSKLDLEAWDSDDEEGPAVPLAPPPKKRARTPDDPESDQERSSDRDSIPVASSSKKVDVRDELEEEERERRAAIRPVVPSRRPAAHHDRQKRPMPVRISSAVREMSASLFKDRS